MTFYKYYMYIAGLHCMQIFSADGGDCVLSVADGVLSGVTASGGLLFSSKKSRQKLT